MDFVPPDKMFNNSYVYHSSMSNTMNKHFTDAAQTLGKLFPQQILEIGSNDGVFLKHWPTDTTQAVEPCANFADITNKMGYTTHCDWWSLDLAVALETKFDLIYAANCLCHIQDIHDALDGIYHALTDNGIFVAEDPSLLEMLKRNSYDQIYDEHAHMFCTSSLSNIASAHGLEIADVEPLSVHGGSNRTYFKKSNNKIIATSPRVHQNIKNEYYDGATSLYSLKSFATRVQQSRFELVKTLYSMKEAGNKIISYGATSKSTTVFNYCNIGSDIIDCIVDTTPSKQGKLSPGTHIPVVSRDEGMKDANVVFLGAWNFKDEILQKEQKFLEQGGIFITHVPNVSVISYEQSIK
jgi:methylation protein EvaC